MKYSDAIDFLLDLELFGVKLGLANITRFLDRLGNPQNDYASIHIAGTNGKGSTAAMLEAMLVENGYRVGKFTSPHLVGYRERFRINKRKVQEQYVADFVSDHREFIRNERITFFETATALAFQLFKDEDVEIGIAEVGLGGRLDATNLLNPSASVITQISLDHLKVLGNTIEKIAAEKAGIIKTGVPVVTSATDETAVGVISRIALERDAPVTRLIPLEHYRVVKITTEYTSFQYSNGNGTFSEYRTNLPGAHMAENASLAVKTLEVLRERGVAEKHSRNADGLQKVNWAGRFHVLDGAPKLILDVAHNPHGMKALADALEAILPGRKFVVLFGVLQRLDFELLFDQIARFARKLVICNPVTDRAATIEELVRHAISHRLEFTVIESSGKAYEHAISLAGPDDYVVITGSHFTLGEVYRHLGVEAESAGGVLAINR
jgi:dihydrofolate synthase/folylpolyglutamate synthase